MSINTQATSFDFSRALHQTGIIAAAVCLITAGAKLKFDVNLVPQTMQILPIMLIAGLGGFRVAVAALVAYLTVGSLGAPVFAGTPERGVGIAYMMGGSGGFIAGFLVAAAIVGFAADKFSKWLLPVAMIAGVLAIYALGVLWLAQFFPAEKVAADGFTPLSKAISVGATPFILNDLIEVVLASALILFAPKGLKSFIRGEK